MENNSYEILDIKKDKSELRKNLGLLSVGVLVTGLGIVGMRYFGEAFFNKLHDDTPLNVTAALYGYGSLTAASLLTSTGGGAIMANYIPKFKDSYRKLKNDRKELKFTR